MLTLVGGMVGFLIKQSFTGLRANREDLESHRTSMETALAGIRTEMATHRASVDTALAGIRTEMATLRASVDTSLAGIRSEMAGHREGVDTALAGIRTEMATLRASVDTSLAGIRTEMTDMRAELKEEIGKVDGKVEYLTRRVDGLQSDVSYIRGRLFISDEELPVASQESRTPGPAAQPTASEAVPTSVPASL